MRWYAANVPKGLHGKMSSMFLKEVTMTLEERRKRPAHHIVHDYVNLISAGTEMARSPRPPLNSHLLYSFIFHYRKFADFFSNRHQKVPRKAKRRKRDVDMLARDFAGSKTQCKLPEWKKWEDHMNAHLFHLNYLRTRNSRPWTGYTEVPTMFEEFERAWKVFFDSLPPPHRAEFKEEMELKLAPGSVFADLPLYRG